MRIIVSQDLAQDAMLYFGAEGHEIIVDNDLIANTWYVDPEQEGE